MAFNLLAVHRTQLFGVPKPSVFSQGHRFERSSECHFDEYPLLLDLACTLGMTPHCLISFAASEGSAPGDRPGLIYVEQTPILTS